MSFKKGLSGNPGGRPKASEQVSLLARAEGPRAIRRLATLMNSEDERVSITAAQALLDRGFGKPHQTAEITHIQTRASELSDDELAGIVSNSGSDGVAETQDDPPVLN